MDFEVHGNSNYPGVLFIHGSCTTAETCYSEIVKELEKDHCCILCKLDGHYPGAPDFISLDREAEQIESYINTYWGGSLFALAGLSLGATICVHLLSRKKISVDKVFLDGVYVQNKGRLYAKSCGMICNAGISYMKKGGKIPDWLIEKQFGKGNSCIVEMMYHGISRVSVRNVCDQVYEYKLSNDLTADDLQILCLRGEFEPIPKRSFELLREHIPHIRERIIPGCGHAQYLYRNPRDYAVTLREFLSQDTP